MITKNLQIENARIAFRNFSGKEGKFNPEGVRNFCVFLEDEIASSLHTDGWNIRWLEPRSDDEDPQAYLKVSVKYDKFPPKILLISGNSRTSIEEEEINILDWADIETADLIIRPYNWEVNGKEGVKAYLREAYITIVENEFEKKYRNIPSSNENDEPPF